MKETTICSATACARPSDGWIICQTCGDILSQMLAEVPWMLEELNIVVSLQTRYTTQNSGKAAETPMPVNLKAADVRGELMNALITGARAIAEANGWTVDREPSAWLLHRLSAIRLSVAAPDIMDELGRSYAAAMWVIDRPENRQYLGNCAEAGGDKECPGRIYGRASQHEARCDTCGQTWDAEVRRTALLKDLEDRNCTAAEIARLSTYLGLDLSREQIRKRINTWHKRGLITRAGVAYKPDKDAEEADRVTFRFGDVLGLLARAG